LGWLRLAERQVSLTVRISYVSDALAEVVGVIRAAAEGAEATETRLVDVDAGPCGRVRPVRSA
jgi:hypothetical protein